MSQPPYEPYPVPPHPTYAPPPHHQPGASESGTLANWALALAIIPSLITWIVAVALACTVLGRTEHRRDKGRGTAIAALSVVGAWTVVALILLVAISISAEREGEGLVMVEGRSAIADLRVGDCLLQVNLTDEEQLHVPVVPYDDPHEGEVYAMFDLEGPWTSLAEVDRLSAAGCEERLADYAGQGPRGTEAAYFLPTSRAQYDHDKTIVCVALTPELVNSARGDRSDAKSAPPLAASAWR